MFSHPLLRLHNSHRKPSIYVLPFLFSFEYRNCYLSKENNVAKNSMVFNLHQRKFVFYFTRRGALIVRRLCVLLDAERVFREFSTILEGEVDLDFGSIMVQVFLIEKFYICCPFQIKRDEREPNTYQYCNF